MSNFEINVQTDVQTNGRTNGKGDAYVAVRQMFHAKFDGCLVDENTNFDINVELRHNRTVNRWTDRQMEKWARMSQSQGDVSCKV